MKNPSRHRKVSRSARRQWNLYRSRRSLDKIYTQLQLRTRWGGDKWTALHQEALRRPVNRGAPAWWNWAGHVWPHSTPGRAVAPAWADRVLVDLRAQQQYGEQWTNARLRARRLAPGWYTSTMRMFQYGAPGRGKSVFIIAGKRGGKNSAINYMVQSAAHAQVMTGSSAAALAAAMAPSAQAAARAAQSYAAALAQLQKLMAMPPPAGITMHPTAGAPPTMIKTVASLFASSHVDDEYEPADKRAQIDAERLADATGTPDHAGTILGYRIWSVETTREPVFPLIFRGPNDEEPDVRRETMLEQWASDSTNYHTVQWLSSYGIGTHLWPKRVREYAFHWNNATVATLGVFRDDPRLALGEAPQLQCPKYQVQVPGFFCSCGIWAQYQWDWLPEYPTTRSVQYTKGSGGIIGGLVRGGGKVVESEMGWRSQWVEIVELYCNGWCEMREGKQVDEVAAEYGVPVKRAVDVARWRNEPGYRMREELTRRGECSHPTTPLNDYTPELRLTCDVPFSYDIPH